MLETAFKKIMNTCKIHQIYYSKKSFESLDPGFIPLDNSKCSRDDWREYWPIRQYLLNTLVNDDDLYGFFSPKFIEKTGLTSGDVFAFIQTNPGHDVYTFNPYFHLAAWHPNVFIQARDSHPGIMEVFKSILDQLEIDIDVESIIMSSIDTIYCNYFVARIDFWRHWLAVCEFIFELSENTKHPIGHALHNHTKYVLGDLPMKIFVQERVASFLLSVLNLWKVKQKFIFKNIGYKTAKPIAFLEEMHKLDALKIAFKQTGNPSYIDVYNLERDRLKTEYSLHV